ncbi:MAG: hypothetical protein AB8G99_00365 [Planctomycetaceae bacterium]
MRKPTQPTYEERQRSRHHLGRWISGFGIVVFVFAAILRTYVSELPAEESAWYEILVTNVLPIGGTPGRIMGLILIIIGQMYRIDEW